MNICPLAPALNKSRVILALALVVQAIASAADPAANFVRIDNDHARVLVVSSRPGARSPLHEHLMNRVMIYLDAGKMTLTDTAGGVETLNFKAGQALWSPATTRPHVSLNQSEFPVRIVEVELKSKPGGPNPASAGLSDWVKADPSRFTVELENDQVRVVRERYAPHTQGLPHEHPVAFVVAYLSAGRVKTTAPDGGSKVTTHVAGDVVWHPPGKYGVENIEDAPLERVVVEFKK